MAFLLKMDGGNPLIHLYFIFFIQKLAWKKVTTFFSIIHIFPTSLYIISAQSTLPGMTTKIYVKFPEINQIHSISCTKVSHETSSGNNSR